MIDISCTGTDTTFYRFALRADRPVRVRRLVVGPNAVLAASGSNYATFSLVKFNAGSENGLGLGETDTTVRALAIGEPVLVPQVGEIDEMLKKDESLYVKVVLTGTVTVAAGAQVEAWRRRDV